MPKGKRKTKSGPKSRFESGATSDEDSLNDNASVISNISENAVNDEGGSDGIDESTDDLFEEKLIEAIDGISQKSSQGRAQCLDSVSVAFSKRYLPDFAVDRRYTITDGIERCLKKGRGTEQAAAAHLAMLLCIQMGAGDLSDLLSRDLIPVLSFVANDHSVSAHARAKCCNALGVLTFICNTDDFAVTMRNLQTIFSASYRKGDGTVPIISQDLAVLHSTALSAWTLLATVVPITSLPSLSDLGDLLDSAHLEVRMAAGEAIAVLIEQSRQYNSDEDDDNDDWEPSEELIQKLHQLSTDSHKYRAKKDRKMQRSSFRDILRYVEDDASPNVQIRFGQETLSLDTWCRKKQYDVFCQVLGSGMNLHLKENDLLREILDLGEKITDLNVAVSKQSKLERHLINAAAFKARSIIRAKNRDKRSAALSS
ncbi:unnamed protein product [Bemisia tabaci]|uniref:Interferon-related developmental regulator 1 n=1 Tax=Bemisia tabaci TaxID=7038 RepID=A0A9P0A412_BEMTA|nr:PREDICTED: interferon-related developmental regulator 1 [Bemisia tabaci]CAH0384027.1 unnamed protein product [Bemisia tabaci]